VQIGGRLPPIRQDLYIQLVSFQWRLSDSDRDSTRRSMASWSLNRPTANARFWPRIRARA